MLDHFDIPVSLLGQPAGIHFILYEHERWRLTVDEQQVIALALETYPDPVDAFIAVVESGLFAPVYERLNQAQIAALAKYHEIAPYGRILL